MSLWKETCISLRKPLITETMHARFVYTLAVPRAACLSYWLWAHVRTVDYSIHADEQNLTEGRSTTPLYIGAA